ncbi:hypothetical protein BDZ91DRAFT_54263 [Kalaharituber pfeilii]|nr:hypothetical protein BDZ91DRAFT_54263 [Kalaharituber pfeilii]
MFYLVFLIRLLFQYTLRSAVGCHHVRLMMVSIGCYFCFELRIAISKWHSTVQFCLFHDSCTRAIFSHVSLSYLMGHGVLSLAFHKLAAWVFISACAFIPSLQPCISEDGFISFSYTT